MEPSLLMDNFELLADTVGSVAKLRELKTDDHPVLLKANLGAGHGGASGRYDALRETAFTYAFVLWQVGLPGR